MIERQNVANLYPLTPLQEGMLYHILHQPESRAYFERLEFGLIGALEVAAYQAAWQDVCDRHDILRTVFVVRNTPRPVQVVLKRWPVTFAFEDLSALAETAVRERIAAWKADDLARGFNLTQAVPMRLAVFRLSPTHHRVVWSFSHILLDGWCLGILQQELEACYLARLDGQHAVLPRAPQFSNYVRWLEGRERQAERDFWHQLLQGYTTPTPLPARLTQRFGVGQSSHASASADREEVVVPLSEALSHALQDFSRQLGVTPNSVVQSLWGLVLAGLHGTRDAVFAATVAGRPAELAGAEATVGLFINAVPVRVQFAAEESVAQVVQRVHEQSIRARAHHATPLAEIQAAHPLRNALLDHILVFENYPQQASPGDARLPRVSQDDVDLHEFTHYAFELQFLPATPEGAEGADQPARLRFRFDPQRYAAGQVRRWGEALLTVLQQPPETSVDTALAAALPSWRGPRQCALAASFTVEPVVEACRDWLRQFGQPAQWQIAPYNQCPQALLTEQGELMAAELAFVLYNPEDGLRDLQLDAVATSTAQLQARHEAMCRALAQWLARPHAPPLHIVLLPVLYAERAGELAECVRALAADWAQSVLAHVGAGLSVTDLRDPYASTACPATAWRDAAAWQLGHVPYSDTGIALLGAALARVVLARARAPFKVIAVDCDNTLWSGICGEAGAHGVTVGPAQQLLQRFLLARQEEGFLLVLASKNVADDVWAVFDHHPDMLLRREHIAAEAINWAPKSGNLRALAQQLNLGLNSFIFIDDNPAEIAEVAHHCPEVLGFALPADVSQMGAWLNLLWACDVAAVTAEDRERTRMMQAEATRQAVLTRSRDIDEFLAGIGLKVVVGPMAPHQLARVAQLTQRTNQFNLSGKRRTESEIAALAADPQSVVLAVDVEDQFGAYGLTGVVIAQWGRAVEGIHPDDLVIDTFLLSCRVLGRRVEHAILCAVARLAAQHGCHQVVAPLVVTERNEPIRQFLAAAPWQSRSPECFVAEVAVAQTSVRGVTLIEDFVFTAQPPAPAAPSAAMREIPESQTQTKSQSLTVAPQSVPMLGAPEDEGRYVHAAQFLPWCAAAAGWPWQRPAGLAAPACITAEGSVEAGRQPANADEQAIAAIWSEVLGVTAPPVDVAFALLGGHSLHAVRVVARLERHFGVRLGLAQFHALPDIAALAVWLRSQQQGGGVQHLSTPLPVAPEADTYPLSPNQYRIWLLSRLQFSAAAYHQCAAWRLRGALDVDHLAQAVDAVVARHEALRTVLVDTAYGGVQQRILPAVQGVLQQRTLADTAELETLQAEAEAPFDFAAGPLMRMVVYRKGAEEWVLQWVLHHSISDGWSFGLLVQDLLHAYQHGSLPAAPSVRYRDYAWWTQSPEYAQHLAKARDYWHAHFNPAALPAIGAIPSDFPRPAVPSGRGARLRCSVPLSPSQRARFDELVNTQRSSAFQVLAAVVMSLLARHATHQAEQSTAIPVRIGTPVAGRERHELEEVVGMFVNTVVLDAQVSLDAGLETLLADLGPTTLAALEHGAYPFEQLVDDLALARDTTRHPLFDVLVVLQNTPRETSELAGVTVEDIELPATGAAFDWVFEFAQTEQALTLDLSYATDLYTPDSAARVLARFQTLFYAALAQPQTPLIDLPMLAQDEVALLARWGTGPVVAAPLWGGHLAQRVQAQAESSPQALAVVTEFGQLSYAELFERASVVAHHLRARGVTAGARVGVLLPRNEWAYVAPLAVLQAGGVYVPLDARHPATRLQAQLNDADPVMVLSVPSLLHPVLAGWQGEWLDPSQLKAQPNSDVADDVSTVLRPEDPAYMIYTSGSTGEPKGVVVSHRAFLNMIDAQIAGFSLSAEDVVAQVASCAFDAALSEIFMAWLSGATLAVPAADTVRDGARFGEFLRRQKVSLLTLTPSHLRALEPADYMSVARIILAGEAVLGADVAPLLAQGVTVYNAYGPTETAVCATFMQVTQVGPAYAPVPMGRPLANLRVVVVDAHQQPVPVGGAGELVVYGIGVAQGYWQQPALTAARFVSDARLGRGYRTGDWVRWRHDGVLEYVGRCDDTVKVHGHRIELGEVQARLLALPGVRQAAVALHGDGSEAQLAAWICPPQPVAPLRRALAARVPSYMVPALWMGAEDLPRSPTGKIDWARLHGIDTPLPDTLEAERQPSAHASVLPAFDAQVLALWREVLLRPQMDVDDDFFAQGGNSLLAMRLTRRLERLTGRACPALDIYRAPTVRAWVAALPQQVRQLEQSSGLAARLGPAWNVWGEATAPLIVALPPAPGVGAVYAPLAARLRTRWQVGAVDITQQPISTQLAEWADSIITHLSAQRSLVLLGHSGGGRLALALAARLTECGRVPDVVILLDCWRWSPSDPHIAATLERLAKGAARSDARLLQLTGSALPEDVLARGQFYRQAVDSLPDVSSLPVPIYHLQAELPLSAVPVGFSRDWRAASARAYTTYSLHGSHDNVLLSERLSFNANIIIKVLSEFTQEVPA